MRPRKRHIAPRAEVDAAMKAGTKFRALCGGRFTLDDPTRPVNCKHCVRLAGDEPVASFTPRTTWTWTTSTITRWSKS